MCPLYFAESEATILWIFYLVNINLSYQYYFLIDIHRIIYQVQNARVTMLMTKTIKVIIITVSNNNNDNKDEYVRIHNCDGKSASKYEKQ